jgi:3-hydroxy acid dehydrogenase/malonic semialdehyde reductase
MKTIMVTGATSGFGEAIARQFAQLESWRVIMTGRRQSRLEALQQELGGAEKVHCCCFDVADRNAVKHAIEQLPDAFSTIDVLVNNAGLALGLAPADRTNLDDWDTMVDTNIKGLMYCTRMVLPAMRERNSGYIINIGSVAGNWPYPGGNVYGATKAFVKQFSLSLRADLLGSNIRVTNIEPGIAETEFSLVRFKSDAEQADKVYQNTKALCAQDIANTVYWLAMTPEHVNVTTMEVMPTMQATGALAIHRQVNDN